MKAETGIVVVRDESVGSREERLGLVHRRGGGLNAGSSYFVRSMLPAFYEAGWQLRGILHCICGCKARRIAFIRLTARGPPSGTGTSLHLCMPVRAFPTAGHANKLHCTTFHSSSVLLLIHICHLQCTPRLAHGKLVSLVILSGDGPHSRRRKPFHW